tara:strand:+ start:53 stop:574 length:522 start_codon:yes stop_codon:yes gene_type:complete
MKQNKNSKTKNNRNNLITRSKKCNDHQILNRKTKRCRKCPEGFIKRISYTTKKNTYVHEACIKSRGLPGKTGLRYGGKGQPQGIGPLKKGELGQYGYHHLDKISKSERQSSLRTAVSKMGAPRVVRKLGAIRTYLKNTSPRISNKFYEDQRWVRKTFDSKFKGEYKNSKLFMQ